MAWARDVVYNVTYTFVDSTKKNPDKGYYQFHVGENGGQLPNINEAEWLAFISELGESLKLVSDAHPVAASVSLGYTNDAAVTFGPAPDVERKAKIIYNAVGGFTLETSIPGIKYSVFGTDGETVVRDPSNPDSFNTNTLATDLNSIADKMKNGPTINLATHPVTNSHGDDALTIKSAYKLI